MNAATFLSFAGLLALVSMSEANILFGKVKAESKGHPDLTYKSLFKSANSVFKVWKHVTSGVAFIGEFDTKTIIRAHQSLNLRIPEKVSNPILSVPESSMNLSSVDIPIRNFSINDMKLRMLPKSSKAYDVSFVIPEIRVDFSSSKRPKNRPRGDPIKLQYSFQQINVDMETFFGNFGPPTPHDYVMNAAVKKFEPQKIEVRGFEGKSQFLNSIPVKGSKQFKDIMAVAKRHIPANLKNDPIVREFAQNFFF